MPSRNLVKDYVANDFYHVYNRGANKQAVFLDKDDYAVFLNLLKRYLNIKPAKDNKGREYDNLYGRIELLAFCLMPNHFHILLYQLDETAMTRLMRGVMTSYTRYFNKKYKRLGPLFQDRFKASHILDDSYLLHISRYIHLNPKNYKTWQFSSLSYYLRQKHTSWVRPDRILELFDGNYASFVADYEDYKKTLQATKDELVEG